MLICNGDFKFLVTLLTVQLAIRCDFIDFVFAGNSSIKFGLDPILHCHSNHFLGDKMPELQAASDVRW